MIEIGRRWEENWAGYRHYNVYNWDVSLVETELSILPDQDRKSWAGHLTDFMLCALKERIQSIQRLKQPYVTLTRTKKQIEVYRNHFLAEQEKINEILVSLFRVLLEDR